MEIIRSISLFAESNNMCFVVIGGHAVNSYGISRQTGDIDLLVNRNDSELWDRLLLKMDYTSGQKDSRFARYRSTYIASWPIDLMFVDAVTFAKMYQEAVDYRFGVTNVKVASLRHLATLKIHALKHFQDYRHDKDISDLRALLRHKSCDITRDELKDLCLRYASEDLYNDLKELFQ